MRAIINAQADVLLPQVGEGPLKPENAHFRRTLAAVLSVQVVTLLLLWLLQSRYAG
jgi:hypothetical protein